MILVQLLFSRGSFWGAISKQETFICQKIFSITINARGGSELAIILKDTQTKEETIFNFTGNRIERLISLLDMMNR